MAHPAEYVVTYPTPYYGGRNELRRSSNCKTVLSTAKFWIDVGPGTFWSRAASKHRPKDNTGWRDPASYYCKSISVDSPPLDVVQSSCCSWWKFGAQASASWIWKYYYVNGTTPLDRYDGIWRLNLRNWTKTKALTKLKRSDVNLAETFGERMDTYRMVVAALKEFHAFILAARAGRLGQHLQRKFWRMDPFSLWLEYRYGWQQLFNDIVAGIQAIEDLENGSYQRLRVYVKARTQVPFEESETKVVDHMTFSAKYTGTESCKTRLDFQLLHPDYVTAASLGLTPNVVWELTPWSMVADWFINIGKFLEAWCNLPGWTFKGGSSTTVGDYTCEGKFSPGSYACVSASAIGGRYFAFYREVEDPVPSLALNPEALVGQFAPTRIADMVALIGQLLNR